MKEGFRIYDTHAHVGSARHSGRRHTADDLLREMDRFGVDRSVAIPFPVVEDFRAEHDEIARAAKAHPDRIVGAACIPPFIPEREFRDEVRRCAEVHGFRALKFQPQYQGLNPVSRRSDFLFESALEHRLPVICHTGNGAPFALPSLFIAPARRFPDLTIVLGHSGGSAFYLEAIVAAEVCPNVRLELSLLMPHLVLDVLEHVPASRLMVGSDLPSSLETEMSKILTLEVPAEARRAILWETAARVFGEGPR